MTTKFKRTLEAVWYAAGPAQFLMYGVWVIAVSGMFSLVDGWQLLATTWKFMGATVFAVTIWGTLKQKQLAILSCTITTVVVGAVYTSKAMHFTEIDLDTHRAATQSHYMVIVVLVAWGFYLANLCARQQLEFDKMGIKDG
jgi:hypothetical protein